MVDLQNDPKFQALNLNLVSITVNTQEQTAGSARELGIKVPHLSDAGKVVSTAYGVLRWATPAGTPSHTFILLDKSGKVKWIQDYGHPSNGGRMYVPLDELYRDVSSHLQ